MKTVLVVRLGAFGDLVMITPVLRKLKEEGYHVTVNVKKNQSDAILKNNPHIDKFIYHDPDMPSSEFFEHWKEMAKDYDKYINLSGSIEEYLLKKQGTPEFDWSWEKRHGFCNINYYDHTLEGSGYSDTGQNGELFFSQTEISQGRAFKKKYRDKFIILWSLSGSSYHKAYPYTEYVMQALLAMHKDVMILAVGDLLCDVFSPGLIHPRIKNYIGKWPMRKSVLMTKFADCVVGTDTGLLVAAGTTDTPKVIMLSHTSRENLTKYWKNVTPLSADVGCQPCHRLIYTLDACPLEESIKSPICMSQLPSKTVLNAVNNYYQEWKNGDVIQRKQDALPGRCDRRDLGQYTETLAV